MRGNIVTSSNEKAVTVKSLPKHCQQTCEGCSKDGMCKSQDFAMGRGKSKGKFYF